MADDSVGLFCDLTGADAATALMYLEMSGFDIELATQFFFGAGDAGQQGGSAPTSAADPNNWSGIVFEGDAIPESWRIQGLGFDYVAPSEPVPVSDDGEAGPASSSASSCSSSSSPTNKAWEGLGVVQPKNGPCGVLAVFQSTVIANLLDEGRLKPDVRVTDLDIARALATILLRIALKTTPNPTADDPAIVRLCTSIDERTIEEVVLPSSDGSEQRVIDVLLSHINKFSGAGGAVLLVFSAVLTRTAAKVIADMTSSGAEPVLVVGMFHTCTSGLMNLLLIGWAEDNMSAYKHDGKKNDWGVESRIGLISGMESELRILINDALKFPTRPIYITHGRDHFTLVFQPDTSEPAERFTLVHWNGLPPGGPRFSRLRIEAPHGSVRRAAPTAEEGIGIEYKPTINSVDSVVQAHPTDKSERPKAWKTWRYEVALVIDDPTNVSPELPADHARPVTFELPQDIQAAAIRRPNGPNNDEGAQVTWRCRACYETRFKTMCFGMNEAPLHTPVDQWICRHCDKTRAEVGWTLWLTYDELPGGWQGHADKEFGPKITQLLRSKWIGCQVEFEDEENPP